LNTLQPTFADAKKLVYCIFVLGDTCSNVAVQQLSNATKQTTLPRYLQQVVPMFKKLLAKHQACQYNLVLQHHCPLTLEAYAEIGRVATVLRRSGGASVGKPEEYAHLLAYFSEYRNVGALFKALLLKIWPTELWGSKRNQAVLMDGMAY
jgi:hypothetical protein